MLKLHLVKYIDLEANSRGTVIARTKVTAAPKPIAVDTFFDTAKYEHIPKNVANTILSIKTDLKNNSICSIYSSIKCLLLAL